MTKKIHGSTHHLSTKKSLSSNYTNYTNKIEHSENNIHETCPAQTDTWTDMRNMIEEGNSKVVKL